MKFKNWYNNGVSEKFAYILLTAYRKGASN